ncbi:hypothetical protein BL241_00435 [Ralstonia solanacearum]|nr:hypothetical protein BL241_00435 [Ralstonia solanacearum]
MLLEVASPLEASGEPDISNQPDNLDALARLQELSEHAAPQIAQCARDIDSLFQRLPFTYITSEFK